MLIMVYLRIIIKTLIDIVIFILIIGIYGFHNIVSSQSVKPVNYDEIREIKVEKTIEIGESDKYFPGEFEDLILRSDDSFVVSDRQKVRIEQFDKYGHHEGTIARQGNGPGELISRSFSLINGTNNFIVQYGDSHQVDYFERECDGVYKHVKTWIPEQFNDQRFELIGTHSDTGYYALKKSWVDEIALNLPEYKGDPVVIVDERMNIIQDSLHILKTPNYIFGNYDKYPSPVSMAGLSFLGLPPFRYQDRIRVMNDGSYLIARPDSAVLNFYNPKHELKKQISLNVKRRPVQKNDLEFMFRSNPIASNDEIRRKLESHVDDFKPIFLNIWVTNNHILFHTDSNEGGKEMVVFTMEGVAIGRFYLSEYDDPQYFKDHQVYTLYRNPNLGHSIRVYQVNL